MDLIRLLSEIIDLNSFSNLWFWIVLGVMWSRATHRVMGVPWDMVRRARRSGDAQMTRDVCELAQISARRQLYITRTGGPMLTALTAAGLAALATLGFHYGLHIAQAITLLALPMLLVSLLALRKARRILRNSDAQTVFTLLSRQRISIQLIGMVAIFVTALWGMFQNLSSSVLGN